MKHRIPPHTALLLLLVALFFDFISAILSFFLITSPLTLPTSAVAGGLLWMLFSLQKVRFVGNPKNLTTFAVGVLIEMVPLANALPAWTAVTWRIIYLNNRDFRAQELKEKARVKKEGQENTEKLLLQKAYQEELKLEEELALEEAVNDNTQEEEGEKNAA